MDFMKILLAYMATTLLVAVESTSTPSVTPVPTPAPDATPDTAIVTQAPETWTAEPTVSVTPVPVPTISPNPKYHNLTQGERGDDVRALQQRLIELGYLPEGAADGAYGGQTRNAVRRFQYYNSLQVDGIAGRATQTNLFENPDVMPYPGSATGTPAPEETPSPVPDAETQAPAEVTAGLLTPEPETETAGAPETEAPATEQPETRATEAPAETEAPAAETPAAETEAPAETEAGLLTPEPETEVPETPAAETEAPAADATDAPAEETEAPAETDASQLTPEAEAEPTETPAAETEAPAAEATDAPAEETEAPAETEAQPEALPTEIIEEVFLEEEYEDLAGWIVLNDSGAAMQWNALQDGVTVLRSPRMQIRDEHIRISLDDVCQCVENWTLTDDGDTVVLEVEGYTLGLFNEEAGFAATVDGLELTTEPSDFDFIRDGHFIDVDFLTRALNGTWEWDAEEWTLMLRIPEKSLLNATD